MRANPLLPLLTAALLGGTAPAALAQATIQIVNINEYRTRTFVPGGHLEADESMIRWYGAGCHKYFFRLS